MAAKERPILFSAPMVRAILAGTKTQTRRVVKDLPPWEITEIVPDGGGSGKWLPNGPSSTGHGMASGHWRPCPYGQPGDRLYVRETWNHTALSIDEARAITEDIMSGTAVNYLATFVDEMVAEGMGRQDATEAEQWETWRPSIHMPRWASRIDLEVTGVRVERLLNISERDATADGGFSPITRDCKVPKFRALWESINGAGSWDANPWVWVVEFKRIKP